MSKVIWFAHSTTAGLAVGVEVQSRDGGSLSAALDTLLIEKTFFAPRQAAACGPGLATSEPHSHTM